MMFRFDCFTVTNKTTSRISPMSNKENVMSQLGLDTAQMEQLIRTCTTEATTIESSVRTISGALSSTWWKGGDADRFTSDWQGNYSQQMTRVATELRNVATMLRSQLNEQIQASS